MSDSTTMPNSNSKKPVLKQLAVNPSPQFNAYDGDVTSIASIVGDIFKVNLSEGVSQNVLEKNIVSREFNSDDADVTFCSADRVLFKMHSVYLNANTERFAMPTGTKLDHAVELTESSDTLTLLFRFIYPARHPDLEDLDFTSLQLLAMAAEKYRVFAAMNTCRIRMKHSLPEYAEEVLFYAMQHGYRDIMDAAAPLVVLVPLKDLSSRMPIQCLQSWIKYHDCWLQTLYRALRYHLKAHTDDDDQNSYLFHKFPTLCPQQSSFSGPSTPASVYDTSSSYEYSDEVTTNPVASPSAMISPSTSTPFFSQEQGRASSKLWLSPVLPARSASTRFVSPVLPSRPSAAFPPDPSVLVTGSSKPRASLALSTTSFPPSHLGLSAPSASQPTLPVFPPPAYPSPFTEFIPDPNPNHWCVEGLRKINDILGKMSGDIETLRDLDCTFGDVVTCFTCRATMHSWRKAIEADLDLIPSLSTFF